MICMEIALDLAEKAYKNEEVPVGAVIMRDHKIVARAFNKKENTNIITSHAEINCITKAAKALGTWKLDDCEMYVTLKPCSMCEEVIKQSRIKKVYYLLDKAENKREFYRTEFIKYDDDKLEDKSFKLMNKFFENKRY